MEQLLIASNNIVFDKESDHAIILPEHKEITIIDNGARNVTLELQQGTMLKYITFADNNTAKRTILLRENAHLDWIDVSFGRSATKNEIQLQGKDADAKFRSIYLGKENEQYTTDITVTHNASHTTSNMLTRAALLGSSTGVYRAKVQIKPGMTGCVAHQREDTLLLGNHARMDAEPILEISNNNVKCSHGVAIGRIDEEKLYYLETRGISRSLATSMLVQGFFDQLLISMGEHGSKSREKILQLLE